MCPRIEIRSLGKCGSSEASGKNHSYRIRFSKLLAAARLAIRGVLGTVVGCGLENILYIYSDRRQYWKFSIIIASLTVKRRKEKVNICIEPDCLCD